MPFSPWFSVRESARSCTRAWRMPWAMPATKALGSVTVRVPLISARAIRTHLWGDGLGLWRWASPEMSAPDLGSATTYFGEPYQAWSSARPNGPGSKASSCGGVGNESVVALAARWWSVPGGTLPRLFPRRTRRPGHPSRPGGGPTAAHRSCPRSGQRSGPGPRPRRGRGCGPGDGDGRHRAPDAGTDSRRRPARSPCLLQLRDSASRSGRSSGLTRVRNAGRAQGRTEANQTWEAEWLFT